MIHVYKKGESNMTFILLHGTGGNETDLLPIAEKLDRKANVLGIRGNVIEGGMNRFFRRFDIGQFDLNSFEKEAKVLVQFIRNAAEKYQFDLKHTLIIGFSNGANIMQALNQYTNLEVLGYAFLSPAYINPNALFRKQQGYIFMTASANDPYTTYDQTKKLIEQLKRIGNTEIFMHDAGHYLTNDALNALKDWYEKVKSAI